MTVEITTEELQEELEGVRTSTGVSIDYEGEFKMNKTREVPPKKTDKIQLTKSGKVKMDKEINPYYGEIIKASTMNGQIGFIYGNSVNNQLGREDKELNFVPKPRKWGQRQGVLVYYTNKANVAKVYVELKLTSEKNKVYRYKDGTPIDYELLSPFVTERAASKTQKDLGTEVIVNDIDLDNIKAMRMNKKEYVIDNTIMTREVVSVEEAMAEIEQE